MDYEAPRDLEPRPSLVRPNKRCGRKRRLGTRPLREALIMGQLMMQAACPGCRHVLQILNYLLNGRLNLLGGQKHLFW
jgi:hypothetical protein